MRRPRGASLTREWRAAWPTPRASFGHRAVRGAGVLPPLGYAGAPAAAQGLLLEVFCLADDELQALGRGPSGAAELSLQVLPGEQQRRRPAVRAVVVVLRE